MSRAITYHFVEGERGIVSQRIDRTRTPIGANCSAGSQVIFSRRECTRRMVRLMFSNRATVFDQAPIVLLTAECAAHWHLASAKHDEIAGLSVELGFQVAARGRTRELDAGLDAHRGTPSSTLACRCVTSALLSVENRARFSSEKNEGSEGITSTMTLDTSLHGQSSPDCVCGSQPV